MPEATIVQNLRENESIVQFAGWLEHVSEQFLERVYVKAKDVVADSEGSVVKH
jgi:hypothetical protein